MAHAGSAPVLSRRVLNRTLLQRQLLLERVRRPALEVVEALIGLQAQEPGDPYVGLWDRIDRFDPEELGSAIAARRAVRMGLHRTTLHLVTADDARGLYPAVYSVFLRAYRGSPFARALAEVDIDALVDAARDLLTAGPLAPNELGRRLAERWPDRDPAAMAYTARFLLPLVQVPPRGVWGRTGRTRNTTAEAWLGNPLGPAAPLESIVLRYLAAFGPATAADLRQWSGLTGLDPVIGSLGSRLRTYRDEAGRMLLDLDDGVIADADLPAPVRFLPQYDNVFLSHADRSRINGSLSWGLDFVWKGPILVDGFIDGTWRVRSVGGVATMMIQLGRPLDGPTRAALEAEAGALLGFVAADAATTDLRIVLPV